MDEAPALKRLRGNEDSVVVYSSPTDNVRTSSLSAATLCLTGHSGSVYALSYSPSGQSLCSASFDMTCLLWSHNEDYENYNVLKGHKNAVLDCLWCDEYTIVTCSADKTIQVWDANTGSRIRKWQKHVGVVNACARIGEYGIVSAGDDNCYLWDRRQKSFVDCFQSEYPFTAVAATDECFYTGGIDNLITCWDLKMTRKIYSMKGHQDTVTSLSIHPETTHILSNSMDNTLRSWDIRNFVTGKRHDKTFVGHKHNVEKGLLKCSWSHDGSMVTAGSADGMVHIWDEFSQQELYLLPGHKGCVNTVVFHPSENVIASGASDKQIYVGELS